MFPILYDDVFSLTLSDLKKWGYLVEGQKKKGVVTWSTNGNKAGSISIATILLSDDHYLELKYTCKGNPVNYKVELIMVPSNLGKGKVWYFICPVTGKRCRKLYMVGGRFLHREAFTGCMYEKQTRSRRARELYQVLGKVFSSDALYEELESKNFKSTYAGKPTRRYLRIQKKIDSVIGLTIGDIKSVLSL